MKSLNIISKGINSWKQDFQSENKAKQSLQVNNFTDELNILLLYKNSAKNTNTLLAVRKVGGGVKTGLKGQ